MLFVSDVKQDSIVVTDTDDWVSEEYPSSYIFSLVNKIPIQGITGRKASIVNEIHYDYDGFTVYLNPEGLLTHVAGNAEFNLFAVAMGIRDDFYVNSDNVKVVIELDECTGYTDVCNITKLCSRVLLYKPCLYFDINGLCEDDYVNSIYSSANFLTRYDVIDNNTERYFNKCVTRVLTGIRLENNALFSASPCSGTILSNRSSIMDSFCSNFLANIDESIANKVPDAMYEKYAVSMAKLVTNQDITDNEKTLGVANLLTDMGIDPHLRNILMYIVLYPNITSPYTDLINSKFSIIFQSILQQCVHYLRR